MAKDLGENLLPSAWIAAELGQGASFDWTSGRTSFISFLSGDKSAHEVERGRIGLNVSDFVSTFAN